MLNQLVGPAKTKELYFTGRRVHAKEALARDLQPGRRRRSADYTVTAMAQHIAEGPPIALGFMKQNINRAIEGSLRENLALEADCLTRCAATDDHKEAVTAFMEKRPPIFQGK